MSPLKALRADSVLLSIVVSGFLLLAAVVIVGVVEHAIDLTAVALMLGSMISGTISVVVVLAVKGSKDEDDTS